MSDEAAGPPGGASLFTRAGVDLLVDAASLIVFAGLAITGLLFMERGHGPARGLHDLLGYLMIGLVSLHVIRHARWVASVTAGRLLGDAAARRRTWAALAATTAVLVALGAGGLLRGPGEGRERAEGRARGESHEHRPSGEPRR